jgi:hypothetical protein
MKSLSIDIDEVFKKHGLSQAKNTGRRNNLLSQAQEEFFAREIRKKFPSTTADGRTGQPDIHIPEIQKEVECKLTSPNDEGSITFYADAESLSDGRDYLYVVIDKEFQQFGVFLFEGLTKSDFRDPAPGSKGKVQMIKGRAADKCVPIIGKLENLSEVHRKNHLQKISECSPRAVKTMLKLQQQVAAIDSSLPRYGVRLECL